MFKQVEKLLLRPEIPTPPVEIFVGEGVLHNSPLISICQALRSRIAIIADTAIGATYGKTVQKILGGELFFCPGGEKSKTRSTKEQLEDELLKRKFDKETLLIALGGGVITDLTAFLASTYLRGVPLLLIPTTLLAMVDAAIGGKTGVDTPFGKNLIGTFYHPKAIFADPSLLASLPEKEWTSGLAEILKYGLVIDPSIWERLEQLGVAWKKEAAALILASIRSKIKIIEQDPLENKGLRRILNFGHTVAHALETLSNYTMSHGEAVAIGSIAESWLSHRSGYLAQNDFQRIQKLFHQFPFPFKLPKQFNKSGFLEGMHADKKSKNGQARFVMIDQIGHPLSFGEEYCCAANSKNLDDLIEWMQLEFHG